jgi:hypothetical protein
VSAALQQIASGRFLTAFVKGEFERPARSNGLKARTRALAPPNAGLQRHAHDKRDEVQRIRNETDEARGIQRLDFFAFFFFTAFLRFFFFPTVLCSISGFHRFAVNVGHRESFKWAVQRNVRPWKKDLRP